MGRAGLSQTLVIMRGAELADANGFGSVTLAAVARSLGVQTPSLYAHVRDLAALHDGITGLALDEVSDRIGEATAGRSERDALFGYGNAYRLYAREHPGRWESLQRPAGPAAVTSAGAVRIAHVTNAVFLGYNIVGDARTHAIRVVGAAINGFLNLERLETFSYREPDSGSSWVELLDSLHFLLSQWDKRKDMRRTSGSGLSLLSG